ncbi:MAG: type 1 glutamine amidotransferase [Gammaproteobacteria bacterium]|nr:type 1 glutamine amidotransferase [Gammaproteobacteria bacterium]
MTATLKILVVDGNTRETDEKHVTFGGVATGQHYVNVLRSLRADIDCTIVHPARAGGVVLPAGVGLDAFAGAVWSGSALNVYKDEPAVRAQIDLARAIFSAAVPQFGSCWGLQVAVVAAGGDVRANPRGRELGIVRHIVPTSAGATHAMFVGKRSPFEAIGVHLDEVTALPTNAVVLASNSISTVQAAEIHFGAGVCWGVQYHPEYDLNEIATVIQRHGARLIEERFFADMAMLNRFVGDLRALHTDPSRTDLAWLYGIGDDVLQPQRRRLELRRWLDCQVLRSS